MGSCGNAGPIPAAILGAAGGTKKRTFAFFVAPGAFCCQCSPVPRNPAKEKTPAKRARPSADAILEASAAAFAEHGYGETSLRQLLSRSGVSTTAFYARFASKEEVLRALVLRLLAELETAARVELAQAKGLSDGFERGVNVLFSVLAPQRKLVRILLTEAAASPDVAAALGDLFGGLAAFLASLLTSLDRPGDVARVDAEAVAWSVVGALHMQVLRWAVYEQVKTTELRAQLGAVARSFLPGLRGVADVRKKRGPNAAS
jgi:AcrR family transcriptional regulator